MTTFISYCLYIIAIILGWVIFYYVVKSAVKNGIKEANTVQKLPYQEIQSKPEKAVNPEQMQLQKRYDKGEISFDVYKSEWNKLSS